MNNGCTRILTLPGMILFWGALDNARFMIIVGVPSDGFPTSTCILDDILPCILDALASDRMPPPPGFGAARNRNAGWNPAP